VIGALVEVKEVPARRISSRRRRFARKGRAVGAREMLGLAGR
jgi:hypothetical protein